MALLSLSHVEMLAPVLTHSDCAGCQFAHILDTKQLVWSCKIKTHDPDNVHVDLPAAAHRAYVAAYLVVVTPSAPRNRFAPILFVLSKDDVARCVKATRKYMLLRRDEWQDQSTTNFGDAAVRVQSVLSLAESTKISELRAALITEGRTEGGRVRRNPVREFKRHFQSILQAVPGVPEAPIATTDPLFRSPFYPSVESCIVRLVDKSSWFLCFATPTASGQCAKFDCMSSTVFGPACKIASLPNLLLLFLQDIDTCESGFYAIPYKELFDRHFIHTSDNDLHAKHELVVKLPNFIDGSHWTDPYFISASEDHPHAKLQALAQYAKETDAVYL
jgi:hypothetical protein